MDYIIEKKDFYKVGDTVLIEYWWKPTGKDRFITPVKIKEKHGRKYLVSHNADKSRIKNAPDELIASNKIIHKS